MLNFPVLLAPVTQEHQVELVQAHLLHVTQVGLANQAIVARLAEHLVQALARQVIHIPVLALHNVTPVLNLTLTAQAVVQKLVTLV